MLESKFQADLMDDIAERFPNSVVLKNDPNFIQGFPDLLVLFEDGGWAALEVKISRTADRRPNQEYYVGLLNEMSFARFIYPENKEQILDELSAAFRSRRRARLP